MKIDVLTIFPEIFSGFISSSIISKALEKRLIEINLCNIRDFASPPHFQVDDSPYGGGAGMTMKPEPLSLAIEDSKRRLPKAPVLLLSPSGAKFSQSKAQTFSKNSELIFVCGRYEGIDQRAIDLLVDEEISIGDYVLMGGEIPAMVVTEAVVRLIPGVLGNADSTSFESFSDLGELLLEAPQYTRPPEFRGRAVPEVLLSGNHKAISDWRLEQSRKRTSERRPDLLKNRS